MNTFLFPSNSGANKFNTTSDYEFSALYRHVASLLAFRMSEQI
jgi:hypothetical protein